MKEIDFKGMPDVKTDISNKNESAIQINIQNLYKVWTYVSDCVPKIYLNINKILRQQNEVHFWKRIFKNI